MRNQSFGDNTRKSAAHSECGDSNMVIMVNIRNTGGDITDTIKCELTWPCDKRKMASNLSATNLSATTEFGSSRKQHLSLISDPVSGVDETCSYSHINANRRILPNLNADSIQHDPIYKYRCDECGDVFSDLTKFKTHLAFHRPIYSYLRNTCGEVFKEKEIIDVPTETDRPGLVPEESEVTEAIVTNPRLVVCDDNIDGLQMGVEIEHSDGVHQLTDKQPTEREHEVNSGSSRLFHDVEMLKHTVHECDFSSKDSEQLESSQNIAEDDVNISHENLRGTRCTYERRKKRGAVRMNKPERNGELENCGRTYGVMKGGGDANILTMKHCDPQLICDDFEEWKDEQRAGTMPDQYNGKPVEGCRVSEGKKRKYACHRLHMCEYCGHRFNARKDMNIHILRKHTGKPSHCEVCGRRFSNIGNLKKHRRKHDQYECEECGEVVTSISKFKRHMARHNPTRPYKCNKCGKSFKFKGRLRKHLDTHANVFPFRCKVCPFKTRQNSNLVIHERIHTGETPYVCATCGYRTGYSGLLKNHRCITTRRADV